MVSNVLNLHPRVLSLSEFFSYVGVQPLFRSRRSTGDRMWKLYSGQQNHTRLMLRQPSFEEFLYPANDPNARFGTDDVPSILCATLPHLTQDYEELFDELEPVVRRQPKQPPADHLRHLFAWLCQRYDADVWTERSGASILFAPRLLREFPEARVVHVYRDGRETAVSMSNHYLFRLIAAILRRSRRMGIDPVSLMRWRRLWEKINSWMELMFPILIKPERLPFDKLTIAEFATLWNAMIELEAQMRKEIPPDRYLGVKFEDVQAAPEAQLRRLIRFIDPALEDEAWVRAASAVPRPTRSRFATLSVGEQATVTEACRPGLESLGYSV